MPLSGGILFARMAIVESLRGILSGIGQRANGADSLRVSVAGVMPDVINIEKHTLRFRSGFEIFADDWNRYASSEERLILQQASLDASRDLNREDDAVLGVGKQNNDDDFRKANCPAKEVLRASDYEFALAGDRNRVIFFAVTRLSSDNIDVLFSRYARNAALPIEVLRDLNCEYLTEKGNLLGQRSNFDTDIWPSAIESASRQMVSMQGEQALNPH